MNIIISPLNWGLGHATRIVPIINYLKKNNNIVIAADGNSFFFLKNEFPNLKILQAPNLNITYTNNHKILPLKLFIEIPKLILFYYKNKIWLKKYSKKNKIDLIIADNRFGFFHKKIKSIFITHQINIIPPKNLRFLENIIFLINKINIQKFDKLWIADSKNNKIAAKLSNPYKLNIPYNYIGLISRFYKANISEKKILYDVIAIISGPEPQRTKLENILTDKLKNTKYKCLIIRGITKTRQTKYFNNIKIINHLQTPELIATLLQTNIIISRAGYSSIMDFIAIKKTALLIPTPGQTEQEYLAQNLHKKSLFFCVEQKNFSANFLHIFQKQKDFLQKNIQKLKPDFFNIAKIKNDIS
jgi:uncharacterized protein (TIGR00661 family)